MKYCSKQVKPDWREQSLRDEVRQALGPESRPAAAMKHRSVFSKKKEYTGKKMILLQ